MNVAILDDHPSSNVGVRFFLERSGFTVWDFTTPIELIKQNNLSNFDLFILDIDMPEMSGLQLVKILKKEKVRGKIIMFSALDKQGYKKEAFDLGVDGFLAKSVHMEKFTKEVLKIIAGKKNFQEEFLHESKLPSTPKLTKAQSEIVDCIYRGLARKEAADKLKISVKTYDYHIINLKKTFHAQTTAELREKIYRYYL